MGRSGYAVYAGYRVPRRLGGLSPVQGDKPAVFATAQPDTTARLYGLGVCSAEFLISYPHQCRSFSRKTTKRMGAIAACDLYREGRHSIGYNFKSDHIRNRSEEHTSELQSHVNLVCRLL